MKPLSELVKEWREGWEYNAYADKLEAWLREADKAMVEFSEYDDCLDKGWIRVIRRELLGTTQSSGEGEE